MTDVSRFDYQCCKAKNVSRSVDAHFHEGVRNVALSLFAMKAANTLIIYRNNHIAFELTDLQDSKSLTHNFRIRVGACGSLICR